MSGPDGTKLPRTGHPDPWRARSGETLRACPACRAWGRARTCPASRRKLVDLESRGVSQRGAIQIHPLIRLACDSWQRRDQQHTSGSRRQARQHQLADYKGCFVAIILEQPAYALIVPSRPIRFWLLILLLQVLPRIKTKTDFV